MAGNFGARAGFASSGPSATVCLHGRPHEALGDENSQCFDFGMAKRMQGIKYQVAKRGISVGAWIARRSVAVQLDFITGNEEFLEL